MLTAKEADLCLKDNRWPTEGEFALLTVYSVENKKTTILLDHADFKQVAEWIIHNHDLSKYNNPHLTRVCEALANGTKLYWNEILNSVRCLSHKYEVINTYDFEEMNKARGQYYQRQRDVEAQFKEYLKKTYNVAEKKFDHLYDLALTQREAQHEEDKDDLRYHQDVESFFKNLVTLVEP